MEYAANFFKPHPTPDASDEPKDRSAKQRQQSDFCRRFTTSNHCYCTEAESSREDSCDECVELVPANSSLDAVVNVCRRVPAGTKHVADEYRNLKCGNPGNGQQLHILQLLQDRI